MTIRIGLQATNDIYKRNAEIISTNLAQAGIRAGKFPDDRTDHGKGRADAQPAE